MAADPTASSMQLPPPASPSAAGTSSFQSGGYHNYFDYSGLAPSSGSLSAYLPPLSSHASSGNVRKDYFDRGSGSIAIPPLPGNPLTLSPITPQGVGSYSPSALPALKRPRSERRDDSVYSETEEKGKNRSAGLPSQNLTDEGGQSEEKEDDKGANGRSLKQSKRAAQNRAAQQAFRKRKEDRIKELEEKERQLALYEMRERELQHRERILIEREAAFRNIGGFASPTNPQSERFHSSNHPPDHTRAPHYSPPLPPSTQSYHQTGEDHTTLTRLKIELSYTQAEVANLKQKLSAKDELCDGLRRSLEDMADQNRNLRQSCHNQPERSIKDEFIPPAPPEASTS